MPLLRRLRLQDQHVTTADTDRLSEPSPEQTSRMQMPDGRAIGGAIWRAFKWSGLGILALAFAVHFYALWTGLLQPPVTLNMMGTAFSGTALKRDTVPLEKISPNLVYAVIAAEDSKFCQHDGIDMAAIQKAIDERKAGGKLRGASTISQQTAKNVFLWNGGGFVRKAAEAWMTLVIETGWDKRRIMEVYLNVAEWGDGIYGAEAAAQNRFGKPASELSTREAALLASVLPSPNKWRVDPPGNYVAGRASTIQQRMNVVRNDGLASCVYPKG